MTPLTVAATALDDCWNRIGVRGDGSCPELPKVVHCHNCPVFAAAGRRFLDNPSPDGYLDEWTRRLAAPVEEASCDLHSVLLFRIGEEWLALPVQTLIEITVTRPVHRIPFRGGLLAGLVNIRGELYLCVRIDQLLGISASASGGRELLDRESSQGAHAPRSADLNSQSQAASVPRSQQRLLVVNWETDRWVFAVDEVDRVHRFPATDVTAIPATVGRAAARYTRGVFSCGDHTIGYLDDERLFEALRVKLR